jgi:hypothetical protein
MEISEDLLKMIGAGMSLIGTIILAVRVTKLLSTISLAVKSHDLNFSIQAERANGNSNLPNILMYGNSKHIEDAENLGVKLLVLGFSLQIFGGIFTAASYLL